VETNRAEREMVEASQQKLRVKKAKRTAQPSPAPVE